MAPVGGAASPLALAAHVTQYTRLSMLPTTSTGASRVPPIAGAVSSPALTDSVHSSTPAELSATSVPFLDASTTTPSAEMTGDV